MIPIQDIVVLVKVLNDEADRAMKIWHEALDNGRSESDNLVVAARQKEADFTHVIAALHMLYKKNAALPHPQIFGVN